MAKLSVIEGFFGNPWPRENRSVLLHTLPRLGYYSYMYAPKADRSLRKDWTREWTDDEISYLSEMASGCRAVGLKFGIGLSPMEAYSNFDAATEKLLLAKLETMKMVVQVDEIGILFDDMKGDFPDLAEKQSAILNLVASSASPARIVACPTYYSNSPILDRVFGKRPEGYCQQLGKLVDSRVELFWTGEEVISRSYSREHLEQVAEWFQRKPTLWDNFTVNDNRALSDFLTVKPVSGAAGDLPRLLAGHFVNPLKQACLSVLPLATLAMSYSNPGYDAASAFDEALECVEDSVLRQCLREDFIDFTEIGTSNLAPERRASLSKKYSALSSQTLSSKPRSGQHLCEEIIGWLNGEYKFDPNCLTD